MFFSIRSPTCDSKVCGIGFEPIKGSDQWSLKERKKYFGHFNLDKWEKSCEIVTCQLHTDGKLDRSLSGGGDWRGKIGRDSN